MFLILLVFLVGSAACVTEVEPFQCFSDGVVQDDDPLTSTVCCDPDDEQGAADCLAFYQDDARLGPVAALAICAPEGVCAVDCRPGQNCACVSGADCQGRCVDEQGQERPCGCGAISGSQAACAALGQPAEARCSVCRECLTDVDCQGRQEGPRCLQRAFCGCQEQADCAPGQVCDPAGRCQASG